VKNKEETIRDCDQDKASEHKILAIGDISTERIQLLTVNDDIAKGTCAAETYKSWQN
jgi:hypothetical protein